MIVRTVLLLAAVAFAFCAMVTGFQWGWLGIDPSARMYAGYLAASVMFFAASFLPWGEWGRRYAG